MQGDLAYRLIRHAFEWVVRPQRSFREAMFTLKKKGTFNRRSLCIKSLQQLKNEESHRLTTYSISFCKAAGVHSFVRPFLKLSQGG